MENYINHFDSISKIIDDLSTSISDDEKQVHLNFINDKIQELQSAAEKKLRSQFDQTLKRAVNEMKTIKIHRI